MWKSTVGHTIASTSTHAKKMIAENENDPDEWDTDPDFVVNFYVKKIRCKFLNNKVNALKKQIEFSQRERAKMGLKDYSGLGSTRFSKVSITKIHSFNR